MKQGYLRRNKRLNHKKTRGNQLRLGRRVVNPREKRRSNKNRRSDQSRDEYCEGDDFIILILCPLEIAGTEMLADDNRYRVSHSEEYDIEDLADRAGYILTRDHIEAAHGVALGKHRHTRAPERFIDEQRRTGKEEFPDEVPRNEQGGVNTFHIRASVFMGMSPYRNNRQLRETRENGRDSRAFYSEPREAEFSVDKQIIEYQIDCDRRDSRSHRNYRFPAFAKGISVNLNHGESRQTEQNYKHIVHRVAAGSLEISPVAAAVEVERNELTAEAGKDYQRSGCKNNSEPELIPESAANSFIILRAVILRGKNSGARKAAENAKIKYEKQLVDYRHSAHLLGARAPDHYIIKQRDEIRDTRLHHYRHGDCQHPFIKCAVAYEFLFECYPVFREILHIQLRLFPNNTRILYHK